MLLERNGSDFPQYFHLIDDHGNQGKVKPSGGGIEMEGQFNLILDVNGELEFIQVDFDRLLDLLDHHQIPHVKQRRMNQRF